MKRWLLSTLAVLCVAPSALAQAPAATFADAAALVNKLSNGGFEAAKPAYWDASGAGATWSTAQAHSATYSLALSGAGRGVVDDGRGGAQLDRLHRPARLQRLHAR